MAEPMPRVPPVTKATLPMCLPPFRRSSGSLRPQIEWAPPANRRCSSNHLALVALHAHGDAHAATDAERGKTLLGVALLHLMQQRDEDTCAGGADGMGGGGGAA